MAENKLLILGLAETGKTTFIAALWAYLTMQEGKKEIYLNSLLSGEHEYLNNITRLWLQFNDLPRNRDISKPKEIRMNLKHSTSNSDIDLDIPDFAGETFREHFDTRTWDQEYDERLRQTNGILLFVSPYNENNSPVLIADAEELEGLFAEESAIEIQEEKSVVKEKPILMYSPDMTTNQIKLVEELQFISHQHNEVLPLKLSVVVSAWDKIQGDSQSIISPEEWVNLELPLLHQFLKCNSEKFYGKFFGLSAQGVDYKNEELAEKMYNKPPGERIVVVEDKNRSHNIIKIISWVTE